MFILCNLLVEQVIVMKTTVSKVLLIKSDMWGNRAIIDCYSRHNDNIIDSISDELRYFYLLLSKMSQICVLQDMNHENSSVYMILLCTANLLYLKNLKQHIRDLLLLVT